MTGSLKFDLHVVEIQKYLELLISTELEIDELQKMLLSFITRIDPKIIASGNYDSKTLSILSEGVQVLKKAPFYIVEMEDFTIR